MESLTPKLAQWRKNWTTVLIAGVQWKLGKRNTCLSTGVREGEIWCSWVVLSVAVLSELDKNICQCCLLVTRDDKERLGWEWSCVRATRWATSICLGLIPPFNFLSFSSSSKRRPLSVKTFDEVSVGKEKVMHEVSRVTVSFSTRNTDRLAPTPNSYRSVWNLFGQKKGLNQGEYLAQASQTQVCATAERNLHLLWQII